MLRIVLIVILLALGLWQAAVDWQATLGAGYAYRFTSIGQALYQTWPDRFGPGAGGPVMRGLLSIPIAATFVVAAGLLWLGRPRRR